MDIADRLRLDVPVGQAGMGGGLTTPGRLEASIQRVREQAPGRAVAVNLLLPFTRRRHVAVCVEARVDVVVLAFGENRGLVAHLRLAGAFVFVMVGTVAQARAAIAWGADGLIAQGREAGGHLVGTTAALDFLPHALAAAGGRPVFRQPRRPGRRRRRRHCRHPIPADARVRCEPRLSAASPAGGQHDRNQPVRAELAAAPSGGAQRRHPPVVRRRRQAPRRPLFTPLAPVAGVPDSLLDSAALYAGETASRIGELTSARQAVADLTPR